MCGITELFDGCCFIWSVFAYCSIIMPDNVTRHNTHLKLKLNTQSCATFQRETHPWSIGLVAIKRYNEKVCYWLIGSPKWKTMVFDIDQRFNQNFKMKIHFFCNKQSKLHMHKFICNHCLHHNNYWHQTIMLLEVIWNWVNSQHGPLK